MAYDGGMLRDILCESGVDVTYLKTVEEKNGHAIIQVNGNLMTMDKRFTVANSEGLYTSDRQVRTRLAVAAKQCPAALVVPVFKPVTPV